jgi:hypothetical protein
MKGTIIWDKTSCSASLLPHAITLVSCSAYSTMTMEASVEFQRSIYLSIYDSRTICWALVAFSASWSFTQSVCLLGRGIGPSQGRYLHTGQHKQNKRTQTSMHCYLFIILNGVRLSPHGTAATTGLLYQPLMIDDGDCGSIGGMKIGRGNWSTRRKPAPATLCPPQMPNAHTRARSQAADAVVSQRLTAWANVRPIHALNGIRTHDPSVWAGEDTSCFRQRGHCNRLF